MYPGEDGGSCAVTRSFFWALLAALGNSSSESRSSHRFSRSFFDSCLIFSAASESGVSSAGCGDLAVASSRSAMSTSSSACSCFSAWAAGGTVTESSSIGVAADGDPSSKCGMVMI